MKIIIPFAKKSILIKQKARSARWFCFIMAFGIAAFAILFIPYAQESQVLWFSSLFILSYLLIHWTMGFCSWIYEDKEGKFVLCIRDDHANTNSYIPFEYITHVELCEYAMWRQNHVPSTYANRPFHRIYTQFSYQGPGLIICYTLPKHIVSDSELRSWQFPGPKSKLFFELLKENLPNQPHS